MKPARPSSTASASAIFSFSTYPATAAVPLYKSQQRTLHPSLHLCVLVRLCDSVLASSREATGQRQWIRWGKLQAKLRWAQPLLSWRLLLLPVAGAAVGSPDPSFCVVQMKKDEVMNKASETCQQGQQQAGGFLQQVLHLFYPLVSPLLIVFSWMECRPGIRWRTWHKGLQKLSRMLWAWEEPTPLPPPPPPLPGHDHSAPILIAVWC